MIVLGFEEGGRGNKSRNEGGDGKETDSPLELLERTQFCQ